MRDENRDQNNGTSIDTYKRHCSVIIWTVPSASSGGRVSKSLFCTLSTDRFSMYLMDEGR